MMSEYAWLFKDTKTFRETKKDKYSKLEATVRGNYFQELFVLKL